MWLIGALAVLDHFPHKLFNHEALGWKAEHFHRGWGLIIHSAKSYLICWEIQPSWSIILLNSMVGEEVPTGGMLLSWLRSGCWSWPTCHQLEFCCPPSSWSCSHLLCVQHMHVYLCLSSIFSGSCCRWVVDAYFEVSQGTDTPSPPEGASFSRWRLPSWEMCQLWQKRSQAFPWCVDARVHSLLCVPLRAACQSQEHKGAV